MPIAPHTPTLMHEQQLWRLGYDMVAGVDEAGRGALAGPVMAAAVLLPFAVAQEGVWAEVCDSKLLSAGQRNALEAPIQAAALAWSTAHVEASLIDRLGIAEATRIAMIQTVQLLSPAPTALLIDWVKLPALAIHQKSFAKADQQSVAVAAASILAKVARDRLMIECHSLYPAYGFDRHKGYGTAEHLAAIEREGPCPLHRFSFAPLCRPTLFDLPTPLTTPVRTSVTTSAEAQSHVF